MSKAVIFDLDGIVVDTVPIHFKAWQKMFKEYGQEFSFEDYKKKVDGIPRIDGAKAILTDINDEEIALASQKKQDYFREELDSGEIPIYETTLELIQKLKKENFPLAVISSSKNCTYILKKINLFNVMDTVVDGNRNLKGKPNPEIFLTAAKEIGVPPSDCLVFEDALLGVQAAIAAGMSCVGVDRYDDPKRLKEADLVISDLDKISISQIREF
ncbi:MAG: beta-phosphoglucomutase family hydrolase [Elusimicrobia bacterium]|nr:beta-phosphoglucomutase family hydrolase [Elusimicrobiota bacterium]